MASNVPVSSASVVQIKSEHSAQRKVTSEPSTTVVVSDSSAAGSSVAASLPQLMSVQPHFIVPVQSCGPSPVPATVETEHDEGSEPKRLRVAEEEWTSDS